LIFWPDYYTINYIMLYYCIIMGKSCASGTLESLLRRTYTQPVVTLVPIDTHGIIYYFEKRGYECQNTFSAHSVTVRDNNILIIQVRAQAHRGFVGQANWPLRRYKWPVSGARLKGRKRVTARNAVVRCRKGTYHVLYT